MHGAASAPAITGSGKPTHMHNDLLELSSVSNLHELHVRSDFLERDGFELHFVSHHLEFGFLPKDASCVCVCAGSAIHVHNCDSGFRHLLSSHPKAPSAPKAFPNHNDMRPSSTGSSGFFWLHVSDSHDKFKVVGWFPTQGERVWIAMVPVIMQNSLQCL